MVSLSEIATNSNNNGQASALFATTIPEEAAHDTMSCYVDILNFPFTQELQKMYDDIQIPHGRHLPVDFCHMFYSTNTIRGA